MRFLVACLINLMLLLTWPLRALRRHRAAPKGAWLGLEVDGAVVEIARSATLWDRGPRPLSVHAVREALAEAVTDSRVAGLVVTLRSVATGSATAKSLRDALVAARAKGLRIVAYLPDGGGTKELFVASAAERVLTSPEATLEPMGFAVETPYMGEALERLGIEPEVLARGRFKTAGEPLVARQMSEAQREQLGAFLDTLWKTLIDALAEGRGVSAETAERWVHAGPWTAAEAIAQRLCDAVAYPDELTKVLDSSREDGAVVVPLLGYARRRQLWFMPFTRRPYLAVVPVQGPIVSRAPTSFVPMATEEEFTSALRSVWRDPKALGALVVVNSQGGGALASDHMRRALERLESKKPTVTYMANVAASGGYMIAVASPIVVAQPTTLTGSIGVVMARFGVERLLGKLGLAVEVVKRGERADLSSPARKLSAHERESLERHLEVVYRSFVAAVAKGRRQTVEQVDALAQGRVWSGADAQAHGLVDQLGGLDVALDALRGRIGARAARAEPRVLAARKPRRLMSLMRIPGLAVLLGDATLSLVELSRLGRERVWAWCALGEVDLAERDLR